MKRDTKALIGGLVCWVVSTITIPLALNHRPNYDHPPTTVDSLYHWMGIFGLLLLLAGALAVSGAAVSFSGRLDARKGVLAGLLFVAPGVLYWWISRGRAVHTFAWLFLLVPWFVSLVSGALLLLVAASRAIAANIRS